MRREKFYGAVVAMALAGLCSLPAAAQGSAAAATTATAQTQTAQTAPAKPQTATQKAPLQPQIKQGFWGRLNPFARKKYVQGQMDPIRDRVNEVDGLTAGNAKSISELSAENKAALAKANQEADQANQTADAANQQVQQAATHANELDQQVSQVNTKIQGVDQYQVAQQAELHFQPGPAKLTEGTEQQLDTFLKGLDTDKGYVVEVTAYSTRKGRAGDEASQELADTVVRYLVLQHNVPLFRIYTLGLGNATPVAAQMGAEPATQSTRGGTVEIKVLKNSLATNGKP